MFTEMFIVCLLSLDCRLPGGVLVLDVGGIVDAICDRVNLGNKDPSFGAVPRPAAIPSCDERLAGPLEWSTLYCFGLTVGLQAGSLIAAPRTSGGRVG